MKEKQSHECLHETVSLVFCSAKTRRFGYTCIDGSADMGLCLSCPAADLARLSIGVSTIPGRTLAASTPASPKKCISRIYKLYVVMNPLSTLGLTSSNHHVQSIQSTKQN